MNISKEKINDYSIFIDKIIEFEEKLKNIKGDKKTIGEKKINKNIQDLKKELKKPFNKVKGIEVEGHLEDNDYDVAYDILYTVRKSENKEEAELQLKEYIGDQYEYADHYFTKYNKLSEEEQQNNKYNNFIKTAIEIKFPDGVDYNVNDVDYDNKPSSRAIITNATEKVMPKELKELKPVLQLHYHYTDLFVIGDKKLLFKKISIRKKVALAVYKKLDTLKDTYQLYFNDIGNSSQNGPTIKEQMDINTGKYTINEGDKTYQEINTYIDNIFNILKKKNFNIDANKINANIYQYVSDEISRICEGKLSLNELEKNDTNSKKKTLVGYASYTLGQVVDALRNAVIPGGKSRKHNIRSRKNKNRIKKISNRKSKKGKKSIKYRRKSNRRR